MYVEKKSNNNIESSESEKHRKYERKKSESINGSSIEKYQKIIIKAKAKMKAKA